MPLRVTGRPDRAGYWITGTVTPVGAARGVRIRRRAASDDAGAAHEEARALEVKVMRDFHHGVRRGADRTWPEAVLSYLEAEPRAAATKAFLARLTRFYGPRPLAEIDQALLDQACRVVLRLGAAPGTKRRNAIVPTVAVLNHAAARGWCERPRFDMPVEPRRRVEYLLPNEMERIMAAASPWLRPLVIFLAGTGCRAGEALALDWRDVHLADARAVLHEGETKGGQRRVVRLPPAVVAALAGLSHRDGAVFHSAHGGPWASTQALNWSWRRACRDAGVKAMVKTLRSTWASWFNVLNPDLIALQREGGWAEFDTLGKYVSLVGSEHAAGIRRVWGLSVVGKEKVA